MNFFQQKYLKYRIEKSDEAYRDAIALANMKSWNASVNRLYYSLYYIVSALLLFDDIHTKSHAGVKVAFNQHYIKTGKMADDFGKLLGDLFDLRQKGDYGDMFDVERETVEGLIPGVQLFLKIVNELIKEKNL